MRVLSCIFLFLAACTLSPSTEVSVLKDLASIAEINGYSLAPVSGGEQNLFSKLLQPQEKSLRRSAVLMRENDRRMAIWYEERADAEDDFASMKEKLFKALSPQAKLITDDVIRNAGMEEIFVLSFFDPVLHEEKLTLARIQNTLYEFHGGEGDEAEELLLLL